MIKRRFISGPTVLQAEIATQIATVTKGDDNGRLSCAVATLLHQGFVEPVGKNGRIRNSSNPNRHKEVKMPAVSGLCPV